MRILNLPKPPDPAAPIFAHNPMAYNRAVFEWMNQVKGLTELAHRSVATPCGQQISVSSFSTNTTLHGTSTGTDIVNFICSLVQTLTDKGILSPTITIGNDQ